MTGDASARNAAPPADAPALSGAELDAALRRARRAHPALVVDDAAFAAHLARHALHGAALAAARIEDLYLACAAGGAPPATTTAAAIGAIERAHFPRLGAALARIRGPSTLVDDVRQELRTSLFVTGADGRAPRILDYGGRSALSTWLHTAAVRTALTMLRRRQTHGTAVDDDELIAAAAPVEPELGALKLRDAAGVKDALKAALSSLQDEERAVLRQYYVEHLGIEDIALVYRVVPSTISRRLSRARDALLSALRGEVSRRFGIDARAADSLVRSVRSRIELSRFSRVFD